MYFSSWRRSIGNLMAKAARRGRDRKFSGRANRPPLTVEALESRVLLTVSSAFDVNTALLTVSSDAADPIAITRGNDGNVKVNGADLTGGATAGAAAVKEISVLGGPGANLIDVSAILPSSFQALQSITVDGGGGADTLLAPRQADTWTISGVDTGTLNTWLSFTRVPNLTAGGGTSTLNYQNGGQVTGSVDGTDGSLVFNGTDIPINNTVTAQGSISVNATKSITVAPNVTVNAGGDLTLHVADTYDQRWDPNAQSFKDQGLADRKIDVGSGAHLHGANIALNVDTQVKKIADFALNVLDLRDIRYDGKLTFNAAANTITRDSGSFVDESFKVGDILTIGGTANNNGTGYKIASLTPTVITLDGASPALKNEVANAANLTAAGNPEVQVASFQGAAMFNAAANTITRSSGDFLADKFQPGQVIRVSGASNAGNNGEFRIRTVTATQITLEQINTSGDPVALVNETVASPKQVTITASVVDAPPILSLDPDVTMKSFPKLTITAANANNGGTIQRDIGRWDTDGFRAGQLIWIMGTSLNDGIYRIDSIINGSGTADTLVLTKQAQLVAETTDRFVMVMGIIETFPKMTARDLLDSQLPGNLQIPEILNNQLSKQKPLDITGLRAQGVISEAGSTITVNSGAMLDAPGNVTIGAKALSDVALLTVSQNTQANAGNGNPLQEDNIGVTYASSTATAHAIIQSGATITAGGDFSLTADVTNNLNAQTAIVGGVQGQALKSNTPTSTTRAQVKQANGPTLAITYGRGVSDSQATVSDGAMITAHNVTVGAHNNNNFQVVSDSKLVRPTDTGLASGVAVSDVESNAMSSLGGTVNTTGSTGTVAVDAQSINAANLTRARAQARTTPKDSVVGQTIQAQQYNSQLNAQSNLAAAAAAIFTSSINAAHASLAPNAQISGANEVLVTSRAEDNFKTVAIGASSAGAQTNLAGAVAVTNYTNTADATIGAGAQVAAGQGTDVYAEAIIPDQVQITDDLRKVLSLDLNLPTFDTSSPLAFIENVYNYATGNIKQDLKDRLANVLAQLEPLRAYLQTTTALPDKIATTYVSASAGVGTGTPAPTQNGQPQQSSQYGISGSFNFFTLGNTATASIADNASITVLQSPSQFTLAASNVNSNNDTITFTSPHGLTTGDALIYRSGGAPAIPGLTDGTTYYAVVVDSTRIMLAESRDRARRIAATLGTPIPEKPIHLGTVTGTGHTLTRPSVNVDAQASYETVDLGGLSSVLSIFGQQKNTNTGNSALVNTKADGSAVGVTYLDMTKHNTAHASIGDGVVITAQGDVQVLARTHGLEVEVAETGSAARNVALAGSATVNTLTSDAEAWIANDAKIVAKNLTVHAENDNLVVAVTGSIQQDPTAPNGSSGGTTDLGVGTSVTINDLKNTALAFIGNANNSTGTPGTITTSGDVSIQAHSDERFYSIAIAGASPTLGSTGRTGSPQGVNATNGKQNGGISLSGVVAINDATDNTQAFLSGGVTLFVGRNLNVQAETDAFVLAVSAPFALTRSQVSNVPPSQGSGPIQIAGAFVNNVLHQTTYAFTNGIKVASVGDVSVTAQTNDKLIAVSAGAAGELSRGAQNSSAAIGGSINVNELTADTQASLGAKTVVTAPGKVVVDARETETLVSIAGGTSLKGNFGIGAGIDVGTIHTTVKAFVGDSAHIDNAKGDVRITAESVKSIVSVPASLQNNEQTQQSLGQTQRNNPVLGLAGSASNQNVTTDVEAYVGPLAQVGTAGNVLINADEQTDLVITAGTASGGGDVGVAVSFAGDTLDRIVKAYVAAGAKVTATGNTSAVSDPRGEVSGRGVLINATTHDTIHNIAASGEKTDGMAALTGSVVLSTVTGSVEAAVNTGANVTAGVANSPSDRKVQIRAVDSTDLSSIAGVIDLNVRPNQQQPNSTLKLAFGASAAVNNVSTDVHALINGATVTAPGDITLTAHAQDTIYALTLAGTLQNSTSSAGSVTLAFAGAGAGSGNFLNNTVEALVRPGSTVTTTNGGGVTLSATDGSSITADAGGVGIALSSGKSSADLTFGISVAINEIGSASKPETVLAAIEDSTVQSTAGVTLAAQASPTITALTIGGALQGNNNTQGQGLKASGAGAGSGNTVRGDVEAFLAGSQVDAGGSVLLSATDTSRIKADAGGVSVLLNRGNTVGISVGLGLALNDIESTTRAAIDQGVASLANKSVVTSQGDVALTARSVETIDTLTIAGAASGTLAGTGSGFSLALTGAGAGSGNHLKNNVTATIANGSSVTTTKGAVSLTATDEGPQFTASTAFNSSLDNSQVTAGLRQIFTSNGVPANDALSVEVQQPGKKWAVTDTTTGQRYEIVNTGTQLTIAAVSSLTADAGAVALRLGLGGSGTNINVSIGASAAVDDIQNTYSANVQNSTVSSGDAVALSATSDALIDVLTVAGAGAIGIGGTGGSGFNFAGAGAGSGNTIANNIQAYIANGNVASGNRQPVTLTATDSSTIKAKAVAGALAVNVGSGGSVAITPVIVENHITNTIRADIVDSTVTSAKDVTLTAASTATIDSLAVGVAASVTGSSQGSVSLSGAGAGASVTNQIQNDVEAFFAGSTNVTTSNGGNVGVNAKDAATVTAVAAGGSLSIAFSSQGTAGSLAIGVGLANNDIGDTVEAYIGGIPRFSALPQSAANLDNGQVDTALRQAFASQGIALSTNVTVTVQTAGQQWLITDASNGKQYLIVKSGNLLTVTERTTVNSAGGVSVVADSSSKINATAVGVGASVAIANPKQGIGIAASGAGADATNSVHNTIAAVVGNNSAVTAHDAVKLTATDRLPDGAVHFNASAQFAADLDNGQVDAGLRQAFASQGVALSTNVTVTVQTAGQQWLLTDSSGKQYVIVKSGNVLTVTEPNIQATATAVGVSAAVGIALAVGATTSTNTILNAVDADIQNATVTSTTGNVELSATSDSSIVAKLTPVSVAAGIGGSGAGSNVTSTINGHVDAFVKPKANVSAAGLVKLDAESMANATADTAGGTGAIGLTVSASFATASIGRNTLAFVDDTAHLTSNGLSVNAHAENAATADLLGVAIGIGSGGGGTAKATITGNTEAYTGAATGAVPKGVTTIDAGSGAVTVDATADNLAHATAKGGAGGGITIDAAFAEADIGDGTTTGATLAFLGGGTHLTGSSLESKATGTNTAMADLLAVTVGVLGGAGGKATASIDKGADVEALIAGGATVNVPGAVLVDATGTNTATATGNGGGGIGVHVSALLPTATVAGATRAAVDGTILKADTVAVQANKTGGQDQATASSLVADVTLIGGAGANADAEVTKDAVVEASIGGTVTATGAVSVTAASNDTATGTAKGGAGGAIDATAFFSEANVAGDAKASVDGKILGSKGLTVQANGTNSADAETLAVSVSLAGGSGANSTATITADAATQALVGSTAQVAAGGGAVMVGATGSNTATATANGGGAALLHVAAMLPSATIAAAVRAAVSGNVLNAGGVTVSATAPARTATANLTVGNDGVVSGDGGKATADVSGDIEAYVAPGVTIDSPQGLVHVTAGTGTSGTGTQANATAKGGSGGAVTVAALLADATIEGTTRAYVGEGAQVTAAEIQVDATNTHKATATNLAVGVGVLAGGGGDVTAKNSGNVEAYVGPKGTVTPGVAPTNLQVNGNLKVDATSSQAAISQSNGGAGAFGVAVTVMIGEASALGTTSAFVGDGTHISGIGGAAMPGNLEVKADNLGALASANVLVGGGAIGAGVVVGQAKNVVVGNGDPTKPDTAAYLGKGVTAKVGGNVDVQALGSGEGDANVQAYGGSIGFDVGVPYANASVNPTVSAYVGTGSQVQAGGNVSVNAQLTPNTGNSAPSDVIQSADPTTDNLGFNYPLATGDTVVYHAPAGQPPIGGLQDGREYNVISVGTGLIQFGSTFNAGTVDPARGTITFSTPHDFKTGDRVYYDPEGGTSIIPAGSVNADGIYFVRVIDNLTIKLARTLAEAEAAPSPFQASAVANNAITIANNKFVDGEAVTYHAAATSTFGIDSVDVTPVQIQDPQNSNNKIWVPQTDSTNQVIHVAVNKNIFLSGHTYQTGDAVTYTPPTNGTSIIPAGSVNADGIYYVIKLNDHEIQLAKTYADATSANPVAIALQVTNPTDPTERAAVHTLQETIGGLQDGLTYYVKKAQPTDTTFQLAATPGGTAIALDPTHRNGTYHLGLEGIALVAGSGTQKLVIPLTSASFSGQHVLHGAGDRPLSSIAPPPGTGTSTATVKGGGGALVAQFGVPTAFLSQSPTVSASVGGGTTINAAGNVSVQAGSDESALTNASAAGGSLVLTVGVTRTRVEQNSHTNAYLGSLNATADTVDGAGVVITAGGDFLLGASSQEASDVTGFAGNGALGIDASVADTADHVTYQTRARVGDHAQVTAGGDLQAHTSTQTTARTDSTAIAVGTGAGADSNKEQNKDSNGDNVADGVNINGTSQVVVGKGVTLQATTVDLDAQVAKMDATARAESLAVAPFFFGLTTAFADARVNVTSLANVTIDGGLDSNDRTRITGSAGVDVRAHHDEMLTTRQAGRLSVSLIPPQGARAIGTDSLSNTVNGLAGATIYAGTRTQFTASSQFAGALDQSLFNPGLDLAQVAPGLRQVFTNNGVAPSDKLIVVPLIVDQQLGNKWLIIDTNTGKKYSVILDGTQLAISDTPLVTLPGFAQLALFVEAAANNTVQNSDNSLHKADRYFDSNQASFPAPTRTTTWDSDVVISAGASPDLLVGPDGRIIRATNVTVNGVANPVAGTNAINAQGNIVVGDIFSNAGPGDVVFEAYGGKITKTDAYRAPVNGHYWSTFYFDDSFSAVRITNESTGNLVLNTIDLVHGGTGQPRVALRTKSSAGTEAERATVDMDFALGRDAGSPLIDIKNLSSSNIVLQGTGLSQYPGAAAIENPLGETRILDTGGNILSAGPQTVVRTNTLGNASDPVLPLDFEGISGEQFRGSVVFSSSGPGLGSITRTDGGSWSGLGFRVGDLIEVSGTTLNQGVHQIAAISGSILTVKSSNVFLGGTATVFVTHFHGIEATQGDVGSATNRINVELVHSGGRPEQLFAAAGRDVYLNLTTRVRQDVQGTASFEVKPNIITAGRDVNVLLEQTLAEQAAGGGPGNVVVGVLSEQAYGATFKPFASFFRPDGKYGQTNLAPAWGAFATNARAIASTYDFGLLQAGGDIIVKAAGLDQPHQLLGITALTDLRGTTDHIDATTDGDIRLLEATPGAMRVGTIQSTRGNVLLTVPDLPTSGQDLVVLDNGLVSALDSIRMQAGNNVTIPAGSHLQSGTDVVIEGHLNNTAPTGATIDVLGTITAPIAIVLAEGNSDVVNLARGQDTTPTEVYAQKKNDTIDVRNNGGSVTVFSIVGPNTINVGSKANPQPFSGSATFSASAHTITRTSGSFLADGFSAGQQISVSGTQSNNGTYQIQSVTATVLTLTPSAMLTDETAAGARITNLHGDLNGIVGKVNVLGSGLDTLNVDDTGETTSSQPVFTGSITFDATARSITRDSGDFLADGFKAGQTILVSGTDNNNGSFLIKSVSATTIILADSSTVASETAASARITNATGTLTDKQVAGLGMGQGITYAGLSNLNVYLGTGSDGFAINEINPPTKTVVDGGLGTVPNTVAANFAQDFQGDLALVNFQNGTVQVNRDLVGLLTARMPGDLQLVHVGRTLTNTGVLHATGSVDKLIIGKDLVGKALIDNNLHLMTVGGPVNNLPVPGNVSGLVQVGHDFDLGYVYGTVSGLITVGHDLTMLLKIFGDLSGTTRVTGNVGELAVIGSQSGQFTAGGNVTLMEVGAALTSTGTVRVGGDLWSLHTGSDFTNSSHGFFGQVVVAGNLDQLQVDGVMSGVLAVQGDIGFITALDNGTLFGYGGIIVRNVFSGQIVANGNVYGDLWFTKDFSGRLAVHGRTNPGLVDSQTGILGNLRVDGKITATAAIVSGGEIGDASLGTVLTAGGMAGIVAAKGGVSYGDVGNTSAASIFSPADGVNAAAIDAIFTDMGNQLFIDTTPQGLSNLALILKDLAALHVGNDGNLTGPIP
jgi:hypothetical protein